MGRSGDKKKQEEKALIGFESVRNSCYIRSAFPGNHFSWEKSGRGNAPRFRDLVRLMRIISHNFPATISFSYCDIIRSLFTACRAKGKEREDDSTFQRNNKSFTYGESCTRDPIGSDVHATRRD